MASSFLKRGEIPLVITAVSILIILSGYYLVIPQFTAAADTARKASTIIGGTAAFVALVNVTIVMGRRLMRKEAGHWYFAIWGLIMTYVTIAVGLTYGPFSGVYVKYFQSTQAPLYSAMTGLLIFFILSATYRAFRARSVEAMLLIIPGCIILLGNAPIGELISPLIPQASAWILNIPNSAAARGMTIGTGIGTIALGVRILSGRQRIVGAAE